MQGRSVYGDDQVECVPVVFVTEQVEQVLAVFFVLVAQWIQVFKEQVVGAYTGIFHDRQKDGVNLFISR